jgi:hypothetical protein
MEMQNKVKQYGAGESSTNAEAAGEPSADAVERFHTNADTDVRNESIHHTLGGNPGQASPGDHTHDGSDSVALLAGYEIQTSAAIATWRTQVESALARLGATIKP